MQPYVQLGCDKGIKAIKLKESLLGKNNLNKQGIQMVRAGGCGKHNSHTTHKT